MNFNNNKNVDADIKYDMLKRPQRVSAGIKLLTWCLSFPSFVLNKNKLKKKLSGLKPPYLLLCNHNSFFDFKVATKAIFPHSANYIVAIDGFIKRESLLRKTGCICKRKFTNDITTVKNIIYSIKNLHQIAVMYPEARYSLCGTNAILPKSLGKLIKLLNVPVVTLICNGNHIKSPVWNVQNRRNKTTANMNQVLTREEVKDFSTDKINDIINEAFVYDDYKWQKDNKVQIKDKDRAKGLHKVLYKCPHCLKEFEMDTNGVILYCKNCNAKYEMTSLGALNALNVESKFNHIPDWYEWQRECVRQEIVAGNYCVSDKVNIDSLPNSQGFVNVGAGELIHNKDGFELRFESGEELKKSVNSMYSCHIEYEYNNKGDCVDLSTLEDTYYIYFQNLKNVVTKIALATEELFKLQEE